MTTTDEIFELAIAWGDSRYHGKATKEDVQLDYDNLRTAIESLVAERDALKANLATEKDIADGLDKLARANYEKLLAVKAELAMLNTDYATYKRGAQIQREKWKVERDALVEERDLALATLASRDRNIESLVDERDELKAACDKYSEAEVMPSSPQLASLKPVVWQSWNESEGFGYWGTRAEADINCVDDFEPVPLYRSQS